GLRMSVNRASADERKSEKSRKETLLRLIKYMASYRKSTVIVIFLMMICSVIVVVLPFLAADAVDVRVPEGDFKGLLFITALYIALSLLWWILVRIRVRIMSRVSNSVVLQIRDEAFSHLQELGLYYFDSRPTGKILSRLIGDISSMKQLLNQLVTVLIPNTFFLLAIIFAMFVLNPVLALGAVSSLPVVGIGTFLIMKKNYPVWYDYRQKQSNLAGFVHEAAAGMKVIQSFSAEDEVRKEFRTINDDIRHHWIKAVRLGDTIGIVIDVSIGVGYLMMFLSAVYVLRTDASRVGEIIAFMTYLSLFWQPVRTLSNMYNQLTNNLSGASRVFEILDEESTLKECASAEELPPVKGEVTFDHVSFAYPDEPEKMVLEDVSFTSHPGEKIALVGPTGAGKTTVINLISRFYDPVKGRVLIDGHDISHVTFSSLRKSVGVMTQESFLFSGSIRDNILYGNENATDEEMIRACTLVGAHDFIMRLKDGYDTDTGILTLSQGQRQLVALARTLLSDPAILILDEATSNVDTHTELMVQHGIGVLMEGRTTFVVAHRLSTIRNSDRIFVVQAGGIAEEGSHVELIAKDGLYAALVKAQGQE
ncbi:MAG: ABC transporter ATP-binding protein, partial [Bullifex sp.]